MINWHVLRTYPTFERDISQRLLAVLPGNDIFCPSVRTSHVNRGRTIHKIVGAYPGYTFARWDGTNGNIWHAVNNIHKRLTKIMGGERPWPVLPGIVESWQERADGDCVVEGIIPPAPRKKLGFVAGDHVLLTYGAFERVQALCDWIDDLGAHLQIKGLLARDQGLYIPFVKGAVLVLDEDWKPQSKTQWRRYHRRSTELSEKSGAISQLLT